MEAIQSCRSTNLNCWSGVSLVNQNTSGSETRNPANMATLPQTRIACLFSPGMNISETSPASGVKRMMLRMWL